MDEQVIKKILPDWTLSYTLSEKKGEKLYQAEIATGESTKYSTIRVVNIPTDKAESERLREQFSSEDEYKKYISERIKRKKEEFQFLRKLSGKAGIVSLRESYDISNNDETGYILVARYDYIEPLKRYIKSNGLTVGNAIRMGVDICTGLEVLGQDNIVHGNVRPENIYINSVGRFRLGGFDIDFIKKRKALPEKTISALRYVSPEMCMGEMTDCRSDIYSFGMTLYSLLNDGKLPFEKEFGCDKALKMRLLGEKLPRPAYDAGKLTDIVMKACSFDPNDRYQTPLQMRKELEEAFAEHRKALLDKRAESRAALAGNAMTVSDSRKLVDNDSDFDEAAFDKNAEKKRRAQKKETKTTLAALAAMTVILLLCVATYFGIGREIGDYKITLQDGYSYVYDGEEKTPMVSVDGLTEGKQYIVSYNSNKKIGEATATVKGIGRFRGQRVVKFKITPPDCKSFKADEVTDKTVKLAWQENSNAHNYRIYVYNETENDWERLATLRTYQTEYVVENLEPQTAYKFKIVGTCKKNDKVYKSEGVVATVNTLQSVGW